VSEEETITPIVDFSDTSKQFFTAISGILEIKEDDDQMPIPKKYREMDLFAVTLKDGDQTRIDGRLKFVSGNKIKFSKKIDFENLEEKVREMFSGYKIVTLNFLTLPSNREDILEKIENWEAIEAEITGTVNE
jgi:hypothetical protein